MDSALGSSALVFIKRCAYIAGKDDSRKVKAYEKEYCKRCALYAGCGFVSHSQERKCSKLGVYRDGFRDALIAVKKEYNLTVVYRFEFPVLHVLGFIDRLLGIKE